MKPIIAIIAALLLAGCVSNQPKVVVQRVDVPIPVPCVDRGDIPPERQKETDHLQRQDSFFTKVQAALIDMKGFEQDSTIMRALLEGCTQETN